MLDKEHKEKLEDLVDAFIDMFSRCPEQTEVKIVEGSDSAIIEIHPVQVDAGNLIGAKGKTAKAFRDLISCASGITRHTLHLRVIANKPDRKTRRTRNGNEESNEDLNVREVTATLDSSDE